ncbi:MAG: hypothetical protein K8S56_10075 [Candidatus Cloacimonetes bacterium]|nr:hypothetical protein [Candidatus Cloacimonadota bacterium]
MPLIPFINEKLAEKYDLNETFTESELESKSINKENILILGNYDDLQINDFRINSNSAYDLRVGDEYWCREVSFSLQKGDEITLKPGDFFCVQTIESIIMPKFRVGLIVSKVSALLNGFGVTTTKVDPGYRGPLVIYTYNYSSKNVKLKWGDKFCSLLIFSVDEDIIPYAKEAKKVPSSTRV